MKRFISLSILTFYFVLKEVLIYAQIDAPLTFAWVNPLKNYTTPAKPTFYDAYIALPALSAINLQVYNNFLIYNNLFIRDAEGYPIAMDTESFYSKLSNNNTLNINTDLNLLGFGFRTSKKCFIALDCKFRFDASLSYSKDVIGLLLHGNMAYLGEENPAHLNLNANIKAFQEWGVLIHTNISKKFNLSFRPKLLWGILNLQTNKLNITLTTDPQTYNLTANYNASLQLASIVPYHFEPNFSVDFNHLIPRDFFRNFGAGIDIGAYYKFNRYFSLELGASDLGFLKWKTNCQQISSNLANGGSLYHEGNLVFNGLTTDQINSLINDPDYLSTFLDSLKGYFPLQNSIIENCISYLTPKIYTQFDITLNKNNKFSFLFHGELQTNNFLPSFVVAYSGFYGKFLELNLLYTLKKNSYTNFGAYLGLNMKGLTLYAACSNIVSIIKPTNLSQCTIQAGIVIHWKTKKAHNYPTKDKKEQKNL